MLSSFGAKLESAFAKYGQLCVGIDPHESLLASWELTDNVDGLRSFAFKSLESATGRVGIIKPQVSFFERHGAKGFAVLEELAKAAAETDLVVIMDAKRGDIGTTMAAYGDAWIGENAPFACDALTVSPYLGFDSLLGVIDQCNQVGTGLFVLAATSNPEGAELQRAQIAGESISAQIWRKLQEVNDASSSGQRIGSFGAVVGATLDLNSIGLEKLLEGQKVSATPILAPGFGAQGAQLADTRKLFGSAVEQVIHSVSRSVLAAGSTEMPSLIERSTLELAEALNV